MENLNVEQIRNAVACKTGNIIGCMNDECAYFQKGCGKPLFEDILLLIDFYEEKIFALENRLKECENGYEGTLFLDRCKLHDTEEKVKELTDENDKLHASCTELTQECKKWQGRLGIECEYTKADTVRKMQDGLAVHFGTYTDKDAVKVVDVFKVIGQIAEEMLEEMHND